MPILIKTNKSNLAEWAIIELQGDLEVRGDKIADGEYIGDLNYDKYGQPILIIGHHILHGKEQKMEKPFAVLEKIVQQVNENDDIDESLICDQNTTLHNVTGTLNQSQHNITANEHTVLDSTIAIQHKTKVETEYAVRAIVRRKIIFKSRPKPIIANMSKKN